MDISQKPQTERKPVGRARASVRAAMRSTVAGLPCMFQMSGCSLEVGERTGVTRAVVQDAMLQNLARRVEALERESRGGPALVLPFRRAA